MRLTSVASPELGNRRDVVVYLPPSYASGTRRFRVIYMQDGQNLFDPATSYAGDWVWSQRSTRSPGAPKRSSLALPTRARRGWRSTARYLVPRAGADRESDTSRS